MVSASVQQRMMRKRRPRLRACLGLCLAALSLTACGPGLRDGNYPGEPRFVLRGSLEGVTPSELDSVKSLRISVLWQMVAMPHPVSPPEGSSAAAPANGSSGSSANDGSASAPPADPNVGANPNAPPQPPPAPQPSDQPSSGGQDDAAVQVAFPAPVSLNLYDFPETEPDWPARQAEGTVVVFYDRNGDGRYDAGTETIAGSLQDYRILYVRAPEQSSFYFVNSLLDNSAAFGGPMSLARRTCEAAVEHLSVVSNQQVSLLAGAPPGCPN